MRKTFALTHPKIKVERLVEGAKHDVKKYLKRERKKSLPEGADYWDFDCKFGHSADEAKEVHLSEVNKCIDEVAQLKLEAFYCEILAKPGYRKQDDADEVDDSLSEQ